MSYKTTTLESFFGTSGPAFVGTTQIDGYVGGRPVVLRRLKNGTLLPAIGATLPSAMGTAVVHGYMDGNLLMNFVSFNEDYMWENADGSDIFDAEEKVAMLNGALRASLTSIATDYSRVHKSEITGVLSKNRQALLDAYLPEVSDRTVAMTFSPRVIGMKTPIVYDQVKTPKLSPSERRKQRALEVAQAKRMADAMLENEVAPSGIQDELDEAFGEF